MTAYLDLQLLLLKQMVNGCFVNIENEILLRFLEDIENLLDNWTYPLIHPMLMEEAQKRGFI